MGCLWQKQMGSSQSNKLPKFSLCLSWMCCLVLAAKAWTPLSPKARYHLLLPQLDSRSRVALRKRGGGEAKASPLCQEGEEETWMSLETLVPFPALAASEHPARTVGFKACGRGELCLTYD